MYIAIHQLKTGSILNCIDITKAYIVNRFYKNNCIGS